MHDATTSPKTDSRSEATPDPIDLARRLRECGVKPWHAKEYNEFLTACANAITSLVAERDEAIRQRDASPRFASPLSGILAKYKNLGEIAADLELLTRERNDAQAERDQALAERDEALKVAENSAKWAGRWSELANKIQDQRDHDMRKAKAAVRIVARILRATFEATP